MTGRVTEAQKSVKRAGKGLMSMGVTILKEMKCFKERIG